MADEAEPHATPATIIVAIAANALITLAKLAVSFVSGSSAMFAEALHSTIDTINQGLVIVGYRRSRRPPDPEHPFGYGKEAYFWSLLYAMLLFSVGGVLSVHEGIQSLRDPRLPGHLAASYAVLGVALVAEASSWVFAVRSVARSEPAGSIPRKVFRSKDPSHFVVVGEDSAAIAGVLVALAGLIATQATGSPIYDAIASIVIGVLLATTAVYLIAQTHRLLLGEAAHQELLTEIRAMTRAQPAVMEVGDGVTMHVGPERIIVAIDATFDPDLRAGELARVVDDIERELRSLDSRIDRIFVEPQQREEDLESPTLDPQARSS